MKFLSVLLLFGGYVLVYAAVANGGRFATEPWEGLFEDAYQGKSEVLPSSQTPTAPGQPPAAGAATPAPAKKGGILGAILGGLQNGLKQLLPTLP